MTSSSPSSSTSSQEKRLKGLKRAVGSTVWTHYEEAYTMKTDVRFVVGPGGFF